MTTQKTQSEYQKAIIYCRVSSKRQKDEGHGLESQEQRCREYASSKGYNVEEVFPDDFTGAGDFMKRPAMNALLGYLDNKPHVNFVVIFDDLKRFARDVEFHWKLRQELQARSAKPECLNYNFDDSPEGEFLETILAAQGQLERKQNRRQVIQKMKARLQDGFWVFCPPPALRNIKDNRGRITTPLNAVEPFAGIYKSAIEKYANFDLNTLEDVQRFILAQYAEHGIQQKLSIHGVQSILTELLYTGWMEYEPWGIERMEGKHQGFISIETYQQVQDRLAGKAKPQLRKDYDQDFPLRNYALCKECKTPLTAAWFSGRTKKYAYYLCKDLSCSLKRKMIAKDDIESGFESYLAGIEVEAPIIDLAVAILKELWQQKLAREIESRQEIVSVIGGLEEENRNLASRIAKTTNETLVVEYEATITNNGEKAKKLKEEIDHTDYSQERFQTALEAVGNYLKSPLIQWNNPDYKKKRMLLSMYFEEKFIYDEIEGFKPLKLPDFLGILNEIKKKPLDRVLLVEIISKNLEPIRDYILRWYPVLSETQ